MHRHKRKHTPTIGVERMYQKICRATSTKARTTIRQNTHVISKAVCDNSHVHVSIVQQAGFVVQEAEFAAQQARTCIKFASLLLCKEEEEEEEGHTLLKRARKVVSMMKKDSKLKHPMLTLSYKLEVCFTLLHRVCVCV